MRALERLLYTIVSSSSSAPIRSAHDDRPFAGDYYPALGVRIAEALATALSSGTGTHY